jgi:uncharacterized protein YbbK (DUF523 family)
MDKVLLSACLLGQKVRYDGGSVPVAGDYLARWQAEGRLLAFCPELAGGLKTPRAPAEIEPLADAQMVLTGRARVRDADGVDVSAAFVRGAKMARDRAVKYGCRFAVLTEKSPSCGTAQTYDGHFQGRLIAGQGITAAVLRAAGIRVFSQHQLDQLAAVLT